MPTLHSSTTHTDAHNSTKLKGRYDTLKKQLDEAQGYNIK